MYILHIFHKLILFCNIVCVSDLWVMIDYLCMLGIDRSVFAIQRIDLSPKGGSKSNFLVLFNKIQFQSNKICYKVSLCENFQWQSCSITIPLSKGP